MEFGYWKNNPSVWPVDVLALGAESYTKQELISILNTPTGRRRSSDASLILAKQLIAAKLNLASGSDPALIDGTIQQADELLALQPGRLPYGLGPSTPEGQEMTNIAAALADYNSGLLTPTCSGTNETDGMSKGYQLAHSPGWIGSEHYILDLLTRLAKTPFSGFRASSPHSKRLEGTGSVRLTPNSPTPPFEELMTFGSGGEIVESNNFPSSSRDHGCGRKSCT